jgi:hypothetical protein
MTEQIPDTIRLAGRELPMHSFPLDAWFAHSGRRSPFNSEDSHHWRGYIATWEMHADRLYLVKLRSHLADGRTGNLGDLFPGFPDRVFAHWYSGELRIPQGKEIGYIHAGFGPIHESTLCLAVRKGVVTGRRVDATDTTGL